MTLPDVSRTLCGPPSRAVCGCSADGSGQACGTKSPHQVARSWPDLTVQHDVVWAWLFRLEQGEDCSRRLGLASPWSTDEGSGSPTSSPSRPSGPAWRVRHRVGRPLVRRQPLRDSRPRSARWVHNRAAPRARIEVAARQIHQSRPT
jgi:hypothetical protein